MPLDVHTQRRLTHVSQAAVLTSAMCAIWDAMGVGVAVVDAEGICRYMNPLQQRIDGFKDIVGLHITSLYVPHDFKCIPTIECLQKGSPLLRKVYTYQTTTNFKARTVTDFFPLFDNGVKDGVLAFTTWLDESNFSNKEDKKERPAARASRQILYSFNDVIGIDKALRQTVEAACSTAETDSHVMIWGESGTGKEIFAQAIHSSSKRRDRPFVPVNCAAIPETLLESILFGTTKGAYTDASDKAGLFEEANHGTLLLDELNSMPLGLQAKLLRVLQEKKIRRVGSHEEIHVNVRVISILNQHPLQAVQNEILRRDVFYRLAVASLSVPPLRERREDIPLLAHAFILRAGNLNVRISEAVLNMFADYHWPGNVRELEHVIEGSLANITSDGLIECHSLPPHFLEFYHSSRSDYSGTASTPSLPVKYLPPSAQEVYYNYSNIQRGAVMPIKQCMNAYEKTCIINVLRKTGGNVAKAARMMEITPAGLRYRIKTLQIDEESY